MDSIDYFIDNRPIKAVDTRNMNGQNSALVALIQIHFTIWMSNSIFPLEKLWADSGFDVQVATVAAAEQFRSEQFDIAI